MNDLFKCWIRVQLFFNENRSWSDYCCRKYLWALSRSGAELDRALGGTGEPSVCEEQCMAEGVVRKSLANEQASRVLWLYCSRRMSLINTMEITVIHKHVYIILCTDNVNRYILFFFLSASPTGCSITVCWFLQGHNRWTGMYKYICVYIYFF